MPTAASTRPMAAKPSQDPAERRCGTSAAVAASAAATETGASGAASEADAPDASTASDDGLAGSSLEGRSGEASMRVFQCALGAVG
jgi:hypothetical protein